MWEQVPLVHHIQSMFENEIAAGRGPVIVDGVIYLTEDAGRGIVWTEQDGRRRLIQLSESDDDWIERMVDEDFPVDG